MPLSMERFRVEARLSGSEPWVEGSYRDYHHPVNLPTADPDVHAHALAPDTVFKTRPVQAEYTVHPGIPPSADMPDPSALRNSHPRP